MYGRAKWLIQNLIVYNAEAAIKPYYNQRAKLIVEWGVKVGPRPALISIMLDGV